MVKANVQAIDQLDAEQLGSGMVITDRQLSIVAVSEPTPRWLGFAKNELVGRPVGVLFSAEWSAALLDGIAEAVKKDGCWQGEARHVAKSGKAYMSWMNVYRLSGSEGEWLVWHFVEQTAMPPADRPTPSEWLEVICDSAPFAVVPVAADGIVQDWGLSAERLFGRRKEEAVGRPVWSLFRCGGPTWLPFPPKEQRCGKGMVQRPDGTSANVAYTVIPVLQGDGYIVLIEDETKQKQKEAERRRQVELAKKIQQNLLTPLIQNEAVTMDAVYIPSDDLSGDIYACYQIDLYRYGVIVIDVMGHGISSALVSMLLRSLLRGLIVRVIDPVSVASELEKHVQTLFPDEANDIRHLFSMIYLVIDTKERKIEYTNAGHPAGLLVFDDGSVHELDKGGLAIGSPFSLPFEKGVIHYDKRARLLLYTDGILEEIDPSILQSIEKIRSCTQMCRHLPDKRFLERLISQGPPLVSPSDDICLLSITVHG
ncbi:SpoIIE family protein phosphatase [Geobacillus sp. PK12]|uniref:SpoIIE family protein phosphatase n=1 Tax=Geobacillus sp. PK12 TaxID=2508525 RepID=UPI001010A491|nr:SpoIIE family protein phosphatase [Geobacillus sp. PK12]RXS85516.1 PAS domain-containing protein [Geobacillus sp. PK12]